MLVLRVCLQQINATYCQIEYQWNFWLCSIPRRFRFEMFPVAVKGLRLSAGPVNRDHNLRWRRYVDDLPFATKQPPTDA